MGWLSIVAFGLGGVSLIGATLARRGFLARIDGLQRSLEQAPKASATRTDLPPEVVALARRLGIFDNGGGRLVRLTQSGEMRLKPGAKPLAFTARQIIAVAEIGFVWRAWFRTIGLSMQIVDYLVDGEGGLPGRFLDVFPVVRTADTDAAFRGEAMRYLGELMWNPDALLFNRQLDWRVINSRTLGVARGNGARRCELRLALDEAGDLVSMEADDRPRQDDGVVTTCQWFGRGGDYRTYGGRRIPTEAVAGCILDGVEFIYWRGRIESWSIEV